MAASFSAARTVAAGFFSGSAGRRRGASGRYGYAETVAPGRFAAWPSFPCGGASASSCSRSTPTPGVWERASPTIPPRPAAPSTVVSSPASPFASDSPVSRKDHKQLSTPEVADRVRAPERRSRDLDDASLERTRRRHSEIEPDQAERRAVLSAEGKSAPQQRERRPAAQRIASAPPIPPRPE